jgi:hypothetical protein
LTFWGRIESAALPEFYSRSTALVVPSFREQFCIAAVEAMMCGCPVIAARVGGLQDVIVDGRTGHLFERGNATPLVALLASYLRAPALPHWLGSNAEFWARATFDAKAIYPLFAQLLAEPASFKSERWLGPSDEQFNKRHITTLLPKVQVALDADVLSFNDVTSSPSLSFVVTLRSQRKAFVKLYSNRPTVLSCLHRVPFPGEASQLPRERLQMVLNLADQDFLPSVISHDIHMGLIIQEYFVPGNLTDFKDAKHYLTLACQQMRSVALAPDLTATKSELLATLANYSAPNHTLLDLVDRLSATLHAPLIGGNLRTRRLHPQIELFRIGRWLEENSFLLPRDYVTRATASLSLLLSERPLVCTMPVFAHGTLKAEHVLLSHRGFKLCDFDHAGFFCGPVDEAHWIWDYHLQWRGAHPGAMLKFLANEIDNEEQFHLAVCWTVAFQLNRDLALFACGNLSSLSKTMAFLYELPEALRDVGYTIR